MTHWHRDLEKLTLSEYGHFVALEDMVSIDRDGDNKIVMKYNDGKQYVVVTEKEEGATETDTLIDLWMKVKLGDEKVVLMKYADGNGISVVRKMV